MKIPQYQVLVCTNEREPDEYWFGCCSTKDSWDLYKCFRSEISKRGLKNQIWVTRTGCLWPCWVGPVVAVQPDGVWYGSIKKSDVDAIIEQHLINGQPLEQLMIHGKDGMLPPPGKPVQPN